jgi:hypothetical protein
MVDDEEVEVEVVIYIRIDCKDGESRITVCNSQICVTVEYDTHSHREQNQKTIKEHRP